MALVEYAVDGAVGVISLNRPEKANAQNAALIEELHGAFTRAAGDDDVRVIVLRANGRHFSSGHDLSSPEEEHGYHANEAERGILDHYRYEEEVFVGYCLQWRNLPKPTIAAVQGACLAAGLMLAWPCDLIVAADDARFGDPVMLLGMGPGVEYGAHTWELGARRCKEMLFTGSHFVTAEEGLALGMVNRVVPRAELDEATMALAREIAEMDPFALRMAKRAVNSTLDIQGFTSSIQAVFDIHMVNHANTAAKIGHNKVITQDGSEMESVQWIAERNRRAALA
jgi:enoyl-CoA hydratase